MLDLGWAKLGYFRVEQTLLLPSLALFSYLSHFLDCAVACVWEGGSSQGVGESKCRWLWRTWLILKDWLRYAEMRTLNFSCELYSSIVGIRPMCTASERRSPENTGAWCLENWRGMSRVKGERERTRSLNDERNVSFLGEKQSSTTEEMAVLSSFWVRSGECK